MIPILLVSSAFAVAQYPGLVDNYLAMPCTPTCDLCHASSAGGGVANQTFAQAMQARGLTSNTGTLDAALALMESDGIDSDGDGISDTVELADGRNPNPGGSDFCPLAGGPTYGCLSSAPAPGRGLAWLVLAGAALLRRRSRPTR